MIYCENNFEYFLEVSFITKSKSHKTVSFIFDRSFLINNDDFQFRKKIKNPNRTRSAFWAVKEFFETRWDRKRFHIKTDDFDHFFQNYTTLQVKEAVICFSRVAVIWIFHIVLQSYILQFYLFWNQTYMAVICVCSNMFFQSYALQLYVFLWRI